MHLHQRSIIRDYQQKIAEKCQGLRTPEGFAINFFIDCLHQNVTESGSFISS